MLISDLEDGVVSGARLINKYANVKAYFEQPVKISDAAALLGRNAVKLREIYGEQCRRNMYKYAKSARKMPDSNYKDLQKNG